MTVIKKKPNKKTRAKNFEQERIAGANIALSLADALRGISIKENIDIEKNKSAFMKNPYCRVLYKLESFINECYRPEGVISKLEKKDKEFDSLTSYALYPHKERALEVISLLSILNPGFYEDQFLLSEDYKGNAAKCLNKAIQLLVDVFQISQDEYNSLMEQNANNAEVVASK